VLFNEPKLLKSTANPHFCRLCTRFSALQRAEIAEIMLYSISTVLLVRFSALQRAEIAEIIFSTLSA